MNLRLISPYSKRSAPGSISYRQYESSALTRAHYPLAIIADSHTLASLFELKVL